MSKNSLDNELRCSECNGEPILLDGYYVCRECGLVMMPEYVMPVYQLNKRPKLQGQGKMYSALGARLSIVDGLGSYIDYPRSRYFCDIHGDALDKREQSVFKRLKYHHAMRSRRANLETEYRIFKILNRVVSIIGLSNEIKERAAYFYRKIKNEKNKPYTNNVLLIAVCLVTAIREKGSKAPRTIKEVADTFMEMGHRVNIRSIVREMLRLRVELQLKQRKRQSVDFIYRIISDVLADETVQLRIKQMREDPERYRRVLTTKTLELFDQGITKEMGGRNPYIFAVSVVYAADKAISRRRKRKSILTQKIISRITNVAEFSVRDHFCGVLKEKIVNRG
ncbi:MAG: hypothetical protein ACTSW4_03705 [Candidatus Ranarchaeia archaeon]